MAKKAAKLNTGSEAKTSIEAAAQPASGRTAAQAVLFILACSGLAYEITLTRIFSLLFQYHYAFLALSLAVLGISLGAAAGRVLRDTDRTSAAALANILFGLSLSFPAVAIVLALLPSTASVALHVLVAMAPFVLIGTATTFLFADYASDSGRLYAADLAGAGLGVIAALALLGTVGAFTLIILLGAANAAGLLLLALPSPTHGVKVAGASILALGLAALNAATGSIDYHPLKLADAPPDKTLMQVLKDPEAKASLVYSTWNAFARIDVVETSDPSRKLIFTDGGAGSYMLKFDGDISSMDQERLSLEFLPFAAGPVSKTLILGAGAGKDVVLALLADSPDITAVEVNPAMVATTRRFADYNGNIFDRPGVRLLTGDARAFVDGSSEAFDLIYLNVVYSQAAPPAAQALVENYIFTAEAFQSYLNRLKPGGRLALITHNGLEGTRAAITAIQAMQNQGIAPKDALNHIALMMQNSDDPTQRISALIVGKSELTPAEIDQIQTASQALNLQPLHLPTVFDLGFKNLKEGMALDKFVSIDPTYDLFPTTDNRPFFYKLDPGLPEPVTTALTASAILAAIVLLLALGQQRGPEGAGGLLLYMALIGAGYMLIEISLIQRLQRLVGSPVLAVALILGALLLSGGLGSWLSQRWSEKQLPRRVMLAGVAIAALGAIYALLLPPVLNGLAALPDALRIALVVLLAALIGVPMGMPFPSALRLGAGRQSIAMLWATNGIFAAAGSALAMVLAMTLGFQWVMGLGGAAYLGLAALTRALPRQDA